MPLLSSTGALTSQITYRPVSSWLKTEKTSLLFNQEGSCLKLSQSMGKSAQFSVHQMVLSQSDRRCTLFKPNVRSSSLCEFVIEDLVETKTLAQPLLFIFIFTNLPKCLCRRLCHYFHLHKDWERPDACCQICVLFKICFFPVTGRPNLHLKCILDGGVNGTFIVRRKQLTKLPGSLNVVHNSLIQNELRWKTRGF